MDNVFGGKIANNGLDSFPSLGGYDLARVKFSQASRRLPSAGYIVDLLLQLPKLLQGPFGEHGEITRVPGQNLVAIRFEDTLYASHLFIRLVKLFACLNHNFILKIPFFMPGRCLTC